MYTNKGFYINTEQAPDLKIAKKKRIIFNLWRFGLVPLIIITFLAFLVGLIVYVVQDWSDKVLNSFALASTVILIVEFLVTFIVSIKVKISVFSVLNVSSDIYTYAKIFKIEDCAYEELRTGLASKGSNYYFNKVYNQLAFDFYMGRFQKCCCCMPYANKHKRIDFRLTSYTLIGLSSYFCGDMHTYRESKNCFNAIMQTYKYASNHAHQSNVFLGLDAILESDFERAVEYLSCTSIYPNNRLILSYVNALKSSCFMHLGNHKRRCEVLQEISTFGNTFFNVKAREILASEINEI